MIFVFFFFKQKTAYEIKECDWSSDVCSSDLLEGENYTFWTFVIPACAVNAPHRRDRVWIIANNDGFVRKTVKIKTKLNSENILQKPKQWERFFFHNHRNNNIEFRKEDEPMLCRDDDGVSRELDENRLKALGNAIVPQIPEIIGKAILAQVAEAQERMGVD